MSTPALNPLVDKIRTMHPGVYDDMDDATLTKRVLAKYPQYSDLAAPAIQKPQVNMQEDQGGNIAVPAAVRGGPINRVTPGQAAGGVAAGAAVGSLPFLGAAGTTALAGASKIAKPIAAYAEKNPIKTMMMIDAARRIPVVGKYVPQMAEYLPFLLKEGKVAPMEGELDATAENRAYAGEPAPKAPKWNAHDATAENKPFAGGMDEAPVEAQPQAPRAATMNEPTTAKRLPFMPKPSANDIPQDEWNAGHAIGSEVEGSPRPIPPTVAAKPGTGKMTPTGRKYLQRMQSDIDQNPDRYNPPPADDDLTPLLQQSLDAVKARKAMRQ